VWLYVLCSGFASDEGIELIKCNKLDNKKLLHKLHSHLLQIHLLLTCLGVCFLVNIWYKLLELCN
jgi:hypothetical protein